MPNFEIGTIIAMVVTSTDEPPTGWLWCNGEIVPKAYGALYDVMPGNRVPDLRGLQIMGAGTAPDGVTYPAWSGSSYIVPGGAPSSYALTTADMPSHQHFGWGEGQASENNGIGFGFGRTTNAGYFGPDAPSDYDNYLYGSTFSGGTGDNSIDVTNDDGTSGNTFGSPSNNNKIQLMQPSIALNFFIYAGNYDASIDSVDCEDI